MDEPKIFAAMKALIIEDGKILALKKNINGKSIWDIPGGRMHYGEDPEDCLKREVLEETGLQIEIAAPIGVWHFFRETDKSQVVCSTFLCSKVSGEFDTGNNPDKEEKISTCEWVTPEEFLESDGTFPNESLRKLVREFFGECSCCEHED